MGEGGGPAGPPPPHRRRATVFAWPEELDAWWSARTVPPPDPKEALPAPRPIARLLTAAGLATLAALTVLSAGLAARRLAPAVSREAAVPDRVLEARYLLNRGSVPEIERALALCSTEARSAAANRAGTPARAAIHECLAHGAFVLTRAGRIERSRGLRRARAEAEHALDLDPRRVNALAIATWARFVGDWNAAEAESGYRRAAALDPEAALPRHLLAGLLSIRGRHDGAIASLRSAQRAAPLSAALNDDGCWFFYRARRFTEATAEAERALRLEPGRPGALQCIVDARVARGDHGAARDAAVAMLRSLSDPAADTLAAAPAADAPRLLQRRLLARLEQEPWHDRVPAMPFAMLYAQPRVPARPRPSLLRQPAGRRAPRAAAPSRGGLSAARGGRRVSGKLSPAVSRGSSHPLARLRPSRGDRALWLTD